MMRCRRFWRAFLATLPDSDRPAAAAAGYGRLPRRPAAPPLVDAAVEAVMAGRSRAFASAWPPAGRFGAHRMYGPNEYALLVDSGGRPRAVLRLTGSALLPFDRIDAAFARRCGYAGLAGWREAYGRAAAYLCEEFAPVWPAVAPAAAAVPEEGAYFVANIRIRDELEYERYLERADAVFARYEGEYLAVDTEPVRLEGELEYGRVVLIRFPNREALRRWYDSPEYREILAYRLIGADCDAVLVRGRTPAAD
jgi:uncharacterized protein (DUF1330 family)/uncharacterized protein YhfF